MTAGWRPVEQALARVSHPNVITVFDVGSFEGPVFIAMELVEGSCSRAGLQHYVHAYRGTRPRISISCNVVMTAR